MWVKQLEEFLKSLDLFLNQDKTYIKETKDGFVFLGVHFKNTQTAIENERFQKTISKLHLFAKEPLTLTQFIDKFNQYLEVLKHYYIKLINSKQQELLKDHIVSSITQKLYLQKKAKKINKVKMITELNKIKLYILYKEPKFIKNTIIKKVYTKIKEQNSNKKIQSKKTRVFQKALCCLDNSYSKHCNHLWYIQRKICNKKKKAK